MVAVVTSMPQEFGNFDNILSMKDKTHKATEESIASFAGLGNSLHNDSDLVEEPVPVLQLLGLGTKKLQAKQLRESIAHEMQLGKSLKMVLAQKDSMGWQPLFIAAQKNMFEAVDCLLCMGADVECEDGSGWTPLMHAVVNGNVKIVGRLVAANADVNKFTKDDWNPLSAAIIHNQQQIVDLIMAAGACINTIKARHPFAHEQYLQAQREHSLRTAPAPTPPALYVRNYDQYV